MPSNSRQTRSQSRIQAANCIIWHPEDKGLADDARAWAEFQNTAKTNTCVVIADQDQSCANISSNAQLFLLCHGFEENELSSPKSPGTLMTNQSIEYLPRPSQSNPKPSKTQLNPKELAAYLEEQGLKKDHQTIELAACYSNEYAKCLQLALKEQGYKDITVYGYYRAFIEPTQDHPNGLANLVGPDILNEGDGSLNNSVYMEEDIEKFYDARLVKVCYGSEALVEANKKERTALRKEINLKTDDFSENSQYPLPENKFPLREKKEVQPNKKQRTKPANSDSSLANSYLQQSNSPATNAGGPSRSLLFSSLREKKPEHNLSLNAMPSPDSSSSTRQKPSI